jgi:hypothetical protein
MTTTRGETETWFLSTWDFAKQILPLLPAGLLLGRPGWEGLIPSERVTGLVVVMATISGLISGSLY